MSIFNKKKDKPTQEERILDTRIQLDKLRNKYKNMMEIQRRILKKNPTPHEKEMAEAKIRSGICAYTICCRTAEDLDEITSEMELNQSLRELNQSLKYVNKLARKAKGGISKGSLDKNISMLKKYEDGLQPKAQFGDAAQGAVDEWLGSKWDDVANKFIGGASLQSCMDESRVTLESDPLPYLNGDVFGEGGKGGSVNAEDELRDLLNSDIF
ncbi:MAG: hypothetical protein IJI10_09505 [Eubacterium sp.]|nr:hypothetical protein [Eubacterium sp.]